MFICLLTYIIYSQQNPISLIDDELKTLENCKYAFNGINCGAVPFTDLTESPDDSNKSSSKRKISDEQQTPSETCGQPVKHPAMLKKIK